MSASSGRRGSGRAGSARRLWVLVPILLVASVVAHAQPSAADDPRPEAASLAAPISASAEEPSPIEPPRILSLRVSDLRLPSDVVLEPELAREIRRVRSLRRAALATLGGTLGLDVALVTGMTICIERTGGPDGNSCLWMGITTVFTFMAGAPAFSTLLGVARHRIRRARTMLFFLHPEAARGRGAFLEFGWAS